MSLGASPQIDFNWIVLGLFYWRAESGMDEVICFANVALPPLAKPPSAIALHGKIDSLWSAAQNTG